jgi:hypothetical protein
MDANAARASNRRKGLMTYLMTPGLTAACVRLAIMGLVAIGVSGIVAAGMGTAFGKSFVSGDGPGATYSKARCADYFEYEPGAHNCEQAATFHHYEETVGYRTYAGILGLLLLVGYLFYRRRADSHSQLPAGFTSVAAAVGFGVAGLGLLAQSLILLGRDERAGVGFYLSAGIVACIAAIVSGALLVIVRRRRGLSDEPRRSQSS